MRILSYEMKPQIQLDVLEGRRRQLLRAHRRVERRRASTSCRSTATPTPATSRRRCRPRSYTCATSRRARRPSSADHPAARACGRRTSRSTSSASIADMDLDIAFNKLVGYFRAFQAGDIAHPTGDIYRDLCDSQAGVCRHRAFAFMITANALGIPTRYVAERSARVRRGVVPRAQLAAHRSRRRRAAHGRHRRRQQDAAPPARGGSAIRTNQ